MGSQWTSIVLEVRQLIARWTLPYDISHIAGTEIGGTRTLPAMEHTLDRTNLEISRHMLHLGLGALAHANYHAMFDAGPNHRWPELSVLQAAHAAEILIKAKIAEKEPLLIFNRNPKTKGSQSDTVTFQQLVEGGNSYKFSELPDRLRIDCGIELADVALYRKFGRIRNIIQHLTTPKDTNFSQLALNFVFKVIDPFIHESWGLYAIDYIDDEENYIYVLPGLVSRKIEFLVSPDAATDLDHCEINWPEDDQEYRHKMENRFEHAKRGC